ncbi:16S rRNA (guanine(1207)-N(2))-methyltransferase RsmC [Vibrio alginolyticus]|uniref:16S rRNA (guanine(1207)-N(2))-methyltransferase RsmC n=1 Tax=Vibrio sp. B1FLJ16 TaxID=2751178 RepID=UPI0015F4D45B|nr:16S rRNA (guanine(1207)-N(2))-methyltransferase RsmC [Vibrio sp. B1FLJ16]CAD7811340.1 Specifically methylates the guanine in position 1207 of 16S rRNA in the 30S particle [Vibrio sp. B1FLJ16]CAE6915953.1 Specifically methylates the guanine in position 1207 of 16S rRNA in the 30S particle [Vibrio sp. B1FLJ16]
MSAYIAPSQIAQRQLEYFHGKHVLVAGEVEDLFPLELTAHCESVEVFTSNYSYYRQIRNSDKVKSHFGSEFDIDTQADMLLLYWPKAKAEAEYLLAMLMAKLGLNTEIVVVGENRSGIKSIEKMFKDYGPVNKYDSARRCSFYWGQCINEPAPFHQSDWFKSYTINMGNESLMVKSLPGVFSHGEFDLGSQLLLETLPPLSGKVLDFGCGAGVLGAFMAKSNPGIEIEMCDINAYAITSSQATLEANGLKGKVFASDIYSDTANDYRFIVSNPPFHSGLDTNYNAAETLLGNAPQYLQNNGEMLIVANSFLKYPPIIESGFNNCATLNKNNKFSIYYAKKP